MAFCMVKRRAFFAISEITRCVYEVALQTRGMPKQDREKQVVSRSECCSDSKWQIKLQKIREEAYLTALLRKYLGESEGKHRGFRVVEDKKRQEYRAWMCAWSAT